MDSTLEKSIEKYLTGIVKIRKGLAIKLVPYFFAGLPDRLVLLPGGRIYFIELKRPKGGRVSPIQKIAHKQLERLGFPVYILNTRESIDDFFKNK